MHFPLLLSSESCRTKRNVEHAVGGGHCRYRPTASPRFSCSHFAAFRGSWAGATATHSVAVKTGSLQPSSVLWGRTKRLVASRASVSFAEIRLTAEVNASVNQPFSCPLTLNHFGITSHCSLYLSIQCLERNLCRRKIKIIA